MGTCALAPLPFASVETFWVSLWCGLMSLSLLTAWTEGLSRSAARDITATILVYALFLGVAWTQTIPRTEGLDLSRLDAQALLGLAHSSVPAADAGGPYWGLGSSLLFVLTFCRFRMLCSERGYARQVLIVLACAALSYALYGMAARLLAPESLLWRDRLYYIGSLTGTFVNRNTAATYFGSMAVVCLMLLLPRLRAAATPGLSVREALWLQGRQLSRKTVLMACACAICVVATAATGSRAGFALTLLALAGAAALYIRPSAETGGKWLQIAGVALGLVLVFALLGGRIAGRLQERSLLEDGRLDAYARTLSLIAERPWTGQGLASFELVFPQNRPSSLSIVGIWDKAHSTPLEVASDMGAPVLLAIVLLWLAFGSALVIAATRRRTSIAICGLMVGVLGTAHTLIDFSLQIPGYAVTFAAVTAAGLAQRHNSRGSLHKRAERAVRNSRS